MWQGGHYWCYSLPEFYYDICYKVWGKWVMIKGSHMLTNKNLEYKSERNKFLCPLVPRLKSSQQCGAGLAAYSHTTTLSDTVAKVNRLIVFLHKSHGSLLGVSPTVPLHGWWSVHLKAALHLVPLWSMKSGPGLVQPRVSLCSVSACSLLAFPGTLFESSDA